MTAAQAAERVGMAESELRHVNNIPPRMLVRAGSSLLVSRSAGRNRDVSPQVADNGFLNLQPEVVLKRQAVKARKGDTIAKVASRYGVSAASVAEWNKLPVTAALKPGQSISLLLPQRVARATPASLKAANAAPADSKTAKVAPERVKTAAKASTKTAGSSKSKTPATREKAVAAAPKKPVNKGGTQVASSRPLKKP